MAIGLRKNNKFSHRGLAIFIVTLMIFNCTPYEGTEVDFYRRPFDELKEFFFSTFLGRFIANFTSRPPNNQTLAPVFLEESGNVHQFISPSVNYGYFGSYDYQEYLGRLNAAKIAIKNIDVPGRRKLRIQIITWNAEFVSPLPSDSVEFFSNSKGIRNVDAVDIIFIFFQENIPSENTEEYTTSVVSLLNSKDSTHNWITLGAINLDNLLGTKHRKFVYVNGQSGFAFARDSVKIKNFSSCRYSEKFWRIFKTEKGFLGFSFEIQDYGRLLVLGSHVMMWSVVRSMRTQLSEILNSCASGSNATSLDYFDGGVFIAGDINTRLSLPDLRDYFQKIGYETPLPRKIIMKHLVGFYSTTPAEKLQNLFKQFDTLGAAKKSKISKIRNWLIKYGFTSVDMCYKSGLSYKFVKNCPTKFLHSEMNIVDYYHSCLSTTAGTVIDTIDTGFLDRLIIKYPIESEVERGMLLDSCGKVGTVKSDHLMSVFGVTITY